MKIKSTAVMQHTLTLDNDELSLIYATMRQMVVDTPKNDPKHIGREKLQDLLQTIDDSPNPI